MADAPDHDPPPETIDSRYRVVRPLGRGGMGAVYEVEELASGERCALKLRHQGASTTVERLFEEEFRTLVSLRHAGIVEVFEYGVCPEGAYYTMELLEGSDLEEAAPMPYREVCAALRDAATILGVLHARRLVHRDLSARNLWRTPDGRIKLLDFGALSTFGVADNVVGTAPVVPPEAVHGQRLDQRSDLYSLGALGYWLLTGVHAYPARSIHALPACWQNPPPSFKTLARSTLNRDLEDIPEEVTEIILRLLKLDAARRFQSTQELIDELNVVAGLERGQEEDAATGYLQSAAFVGRKAQRAVFDEHLAHASKGEPRVLFVEGSSGSGRSRLLEQLSVDAQIRGMRALHVRATEGMRPYGVASRLCEAMLHGVPLLARERLKTHGKPLVHLSPAIAGALEETASTRPSTGDAREVRRRQQASLRAWFSEVSRERPLAILVDDVDLADEPSVALLASLARLGKGHNLAIVVTSLEAGGLDKSATLDNLRAQSQVAQLPSFNPRENTELLRSMLGTPPYLERFSERLHRASQGHPARCLELMHYLAEQGIVHYAEGGWSLPQELDIESLPSRGEDGQRRLAKLSDAERDLARRLSLPHFGALPESLCLATQDEDANVVRGRLQRLLRAGVLVGGTAHYRFAHEDVRDLLRAELSTEAARGTHRALAEKLLQSDEALDGMVAAFHLLKAGDHEAGQRVITRATRTSLRDLEQVQEPMPKVLRECIRLLEAEGAGPHVLFAPVIQVVCASYLIHYRYLGQYDERALSLVEAVLRLDVARRVRWLLGAKLSLLIALLFAAISHARRKETSLPVGEAIHAVVQAGTWILGIGATTLDHRRATLGAAMLEPFSALGADHGGWIAHRMAQGFVHLTRGQTARYNAISRQVRDRLSSDRPLAGMPPATFARALAGAKLTLGSTESFKVVGDALEQADEIDAMGPLYAVSADQIRLAHYLSRGEPGLAEHYRRRVEIHAVQVGSCWQTEIWATVGMLRSHCLNHDAVAVKRAAQDLRSLSEGLPSLHAYACWGQGEYLLLRGKYAQALRALDASEYPEGSPALAVLRGAQAAALRGLGHHDEALDAATRGMDTLEEADLEFVFQNYSPRLERALALAHLGRVEEGRALLDDMIARYDVKPAGPVFRGKLHETRGYLERIAGDEEAAQSHLAEARSLYQSVDLPSLKVHAETLDLRTGQREDPSHTSTLQEHLGVTDRLLTQVDQVLGEVRAEVGARAEQSLQLISQVTEAPAGLIVWLGEGNNYRQFGLAQPPMALVEWAQQQLEMAQFEDDETEAFSLEELKAEASARSDEREIEGRTYRLTLIHPGQCNDKPVAAIALGLRADQSVMMPDGRVLDAIGRRLAEVVDSKEKRAVWESTPAIPL